MDSLVLLFPWCGFLIFHPFFFKTVEFLKLNPIGYVPVLEDDGIKIVDSLAILLVSRCIIF